MRGGTGECATSVVGTPYEYNESKRYQRATVGVLRRVGVWACGRMACGRMAYGVWRIGVSAYRRIGDLRREALERL